ncbi:MAG: serine/threonine-protein kinase [Sumerlaeia bacterium]
MDDKTLLAPTLADDERRHFLYKEDFLLFGILVRHDLFQPHHYDLLVEAQHQADPPMALADLLAENANLSPKERGNLQELLDILATPKLREHLPAEMPDADTLIRVPSDTRVDRADAFGAAAAEAQPDPFRTQAAPLRESRPSNPMAPVASGDATIVDSQMAGLSQAPSLSNPSTVFDPANDLSHTLTDEERLRLSTSRLKSEMIGQVLARHIILDRLGSGGQGDVYLAKQVSLNRYVAMKRLEVPRRASAGAFVAAFRKEAQTLAAINHARIVKIFEIFEENGNAFFTMEHINGKTLKDLAKDSGGGMPIEVVANIACQACSALGRTAEDGLIHRDIKPANMMVDENGDLKIVDFGLAEAAAAFQEKDYGFAGTLLFASPEQCQMLPLTPATDQYSLGVTLFYALTGKMPFTGQKMADIIDQHINAPAPAPSSLNEELPRSVDRVIQRMLDKDPAKRFKDFDACYEAWQKVLSDSSTSRRMSNAGANQLLGDSLRRFGKKEKKSMLLQGLLVAAIWLTITAGGILGESSLRNAGLSAFLDWIGDAGTYLLGFSLFCIFYVALARKKQVPVIGSLRAWLYTHIATAVPAVMMLLIHSGNWLRGLAPGGEAAPPWLSVLMGSVLFVTAVSGAVGLVIFRQLRRQLLVSELNLRGSGETNERTRMLSLLSAQLLSGWRLVHYPLAIFFIVLAILHIYVSIKLGS